MRTVAAGRSGIRYPGNMRVIHQQFWTSTVCFNSPTRQQKKRGDTKKFKDIRNDNCTALEINKRESRERYSIMNGNRYVINATTNANANPN